MSQKQQIQNQKILDKTRNKQALSIQILTTEQITFILQCYCQYKAIGQRIFDQILPLYIQQQLIKMIQGFTTVKFAIGCLLGYVVLYSAFLIYNSWDEHYPFPKIVTGLIILVTIAFMIFLQSPARIKQFLLGAGRYNQLRCIDQSKIQNIIKGHPNVETANPKPKNTKKPIPNSYSKIRKYQSVSPADILFQSTKLGEGDAENPRTRQVFSLSSMDYTAVSNPEDQLKRKQYSVLMRQQTTTMQDINILIASEDPRLSKAKFIMGNILKREVNRQIENIQQLQSKLEDLFDINIVQQKNMFSYVSLKDPSFGKTKQPKNINFDDHYQVVLDQIFHLFQNGLLRKCGLRLRQRAAQDFHYRNQKYNQIERLLSQRKTLDRVINFQHSFRSHSTRLQSLQKLKQIAKCYLQNKNPFSNVSSQVEQYEITQMIVWVLSRNINEMVINKMNDAIVYLEQSVRNKGTCFIRWIMRKTQFYTHYNLWVQKIQNNGRETKTGYNCRPGHQNIQSLLVFYFYALHKDQSLRYQLKNVPELDLFVNQIWGL